MADDNTVTFQDAVEFMGTFGDKTHSCPFCESTKWMLSADTERDSTDDDEKTMTLFVPFGTSGELPSIISKGGVSVMAMECRSCGYLFLFSRERIAERLKKFRAGSGETSEGKV
ncbi:hypothetical protein QQL37_12490 [Pantoea agglomerans]|uniref:hypothetical protein n=1 Tax=Enterobacter agglomerans TaxID=549 RepID=UPI00202DA183|nr:hypothetical protein [Pantoea agglomerans]MCL6409933.1 hypothetical protein [Pantoea agglomerans]